MFNPSYKKSFHLFLKFLFFISMNLNSMHNNNNNYNFLNQIINLFDLKNYFNKEIVEKWTPKNTNINFLEAIPNIDFLIPKNENGNYLKIEIPKKENFIENCYPVNSNYNFSKKKIQNIKIFENQNDNSFYDYSENYYMNACIYQKNENLNYTDFPNFKYIYHITETSQIYNLCTSEGWNLKKNNGEFNPDGFYKAIFENKFNLKIDYQNDKYFLNLEKQRDTNKLKILDKTIEAFYFCFLKKNSDIKLIELHNFINFIIGKFKYENDEIYNNGYSIKRIYKICEMVKSKNLPTINSLDQLILQCNIHGENWVLDQIKTKKKDITIEQKEFEEYFTKQENNIKIEKLLFIFFTFGKKLQIKYPENIHHPYPESKKENFLLEFTTFSINFLQKIMGKIKFEKLKKEEEINKEMPMQQSLFYNKKTEKFDIKKETGTEEENKCKAKEKFYLEIDSIIDIFKKK